MRILAIESSCDETAAAIVEDGRKVISSVVNTQIAEHKLYGGVVPEIAGRRHIENISDVVEGALNEANMSLNEVDAIAVTAAPGLIGAVLVGVNFAKGLAFSAKKPLIPVHHIRGHIAANYIAHTELKPPFLCLVVSGGHSNIIEVKDYTDFNIIGKTRDDAAGEAFDKAARSMGFPYPGGVNLDKTAQTSKGGKYKLPRPHVENSPYDFSFSGLKTYVINLIHNSKQKGVEVDIPALCADFQNTVTEMLCSRVELAAKEYEYSTIAVAGGVAANSGLRKGLESLCQKNVYKLFAPPLSLCGDNAAMIGSQAYYEFLKGKTADMALNGKAGMPINQDF